MTYFVLHFWHFQHVQHCISDIKDWIVFIFGNQKAWVSLRMPACLKFFSEFKMADFWPILVSAASTIIGCLTPYSGYHPLNCSDIWEVRRRYWAWWTPFQNIWKIQNGWCNLCWVVNKINIVISLEAWTSGVMLAILKRKLSGAICCDNIGNLNAFILSKWNVST